MRSDEYTDEQEMLHTESLLTSTSWTEHNVQQEGQNTENPERMQQSPSVEPHPEPAQEPLVESDEIVQEYQPKNRNVPTIWKLFSKVFMWETLAMVLSTGLLLAIVLVLANYNHQPQPNWKYVSLNSVISWLSTIAKACVLFTISEGLGQLKWVWFTQKKRPISDLRTFDSASRGIYGSAELIWNLRASSMFDALGPPTGASNFTRNESQRLQRGIQQRPLAAVVHPRFTCTSGNCTWDPIATTAMSSRCTNITEMLRSRCSIITNDSTTPGTKGLSNCSSDLPGTGTGMGGTLAVYQIVKWSERTSVASGSSGSFVYNDSAISPIQIIAPDPDVGVKWQAFECALHPVVRSFRATVNEGFYEEKTLGVWHDGNYSSRDILSREYTLQPHWGPDMGMEHNKTFMISGQAMYTIETFFRNLFAGRMKLDSFGIDFKGNPNYMYASADTVQAVSSEASNITGCIAKSTEKLRCAVENTAEAISKSFRDIALSEQENSNITGKAMASKTYISIRWQWIALPVLVWLLGLITLVGVIWKTRQAIAPTWKDDVMPLLSVYDHDKSEKPKTDHKLSDKQKVRLFESEGRVRLGNELEGTKESRKD